MNSVLIVSDFFIGGGLETRILEQVEVYQRHGVKCYLAAEKYNGRLTKKFDEVLELPLGAHDRKTIIENTDKLVTFCREKEVGMIDAQPLYGVIAASFAAAVLQLPMSYTLHGRYGVPPADDSLLSWFHIALALEQPQMVLIAEYLEKYYQELLNGKDVCVVRNGVMLPEKSAKVEKNGKWIFASRLSEEKSTLLLQAIPVLERAGVKELDVFGTGESEKQVQEFVDSFNSETRNKLKVQLCGWCDSVVDEILGGEYEGGVGMDRVAIEMMSTGLPVVILGYEGLAAGVSKENFDRLTLDNFTSWERTAEAEIIATIKAIRDRPAGYDMRDEVRAKLSSEKIWTERLKKVQEMKADVGRDAMLRAVWQNFYENEGRAREIERIRRRLERTLPWRIKKVLSRLKR